VLVGGEPGPWGPRVVQGRRWRLPKRWGAIASVIALVAVLAIGTTTRLLMQQADSNLTRVAVPELDAPAVASSARNFLVVGSDARDELDPEDRSELTLGDFEGQRSDVIIYISISEDRDTVSLVSLPRDLLVLDDGRQRKLTDTFAGGPDELVRIIRENFGLPVNHYAAISLGGFVEVVRTLGTVEICLDEPLVDRKSGADFETGCHDMEAGEALSYVRSRQGTYGDFDRIGRQQNFIRAVLSELTAARVLANPPQLFRLTEDVASNLTTDDGLEVGTMLGLSGEMRKVVGAGVPMATVPAHPRRIDGVEYMVAYRPGAEAMFADLRAGRALPEPGTRDEREETTVAVFSGGRSQGAALIRQTLAFGGFLAGEAGAGPESTDAGAITVVYELPGEPARAGWVAASLGAPVRPLPAGVELPVGVQVVVAAGDDAAGGDAAGGDAGR
jgi:LCP family protein required for cell wall assembly